MKAKMNWKKWLLVAALALVAAGVVAAAVLVPQFTRVSLVGAAEGDALPLDGAVRFSDRRGADLETISAAVTTTPQMAVEVSDGGDGTFTVRPRVLLRPGAAWDIKVFHQTFSFTAENDLRVAAAFPANGAEAVPVNTWIEVAFNTADVGEEAAEAAIRFSPEVAVRVGMEDGRAVCKPRSPLEYGTTYTVTVAAGLTSENGAALAEDFSFAFTTAPPPEDGQAEEEYFAGPSPSRGTRGDYVYISGTRQNLLPGTVPVFYASMDPAYAQRLAASGRVEVQLYSYDTWKGYAAHLPAHAKGDGYANVPPPPGTPHETLWASAVPLESDSALGWSTREQWAVTFPQALPEGRYAATFLLPGEGDALEKRTVLIQVSGWVVYSARSGEDTLVWVNDSLTGRPVAGARVEVSGLYAGTGATDENGLAQVSTPHNEDAGAGTATVVVAVVAEDGAAFVDLSESGSSDYYYDYDYHDHAVPVAPYGGAPATGDYFAYLFCDRTIYHTTDTVQAWGVIFPCEAGVAQPAKVQLQLEAAGITQEVDVHPDGTFTAELSFADLVSANYASLVLLHGGARVTGTGLSISDFIKPTYTATAGSDKFIYLAGVDEAARLTMAVSLFDGAPAAHIDTTLDLSYWRDFPPVQSPRQTDFATDASGVIQNEVRLSDGSDSWRPTRVSYRYETVDTQQENFGAGGSFYVVSRDVMLTAETQQATDDAFDLLVRTHAIDLSGIETTADLWRRDALRGEAVDTRVKVELHRVWYEKVPASTDDDEINRSTIQRYTTQKREELVETRTVTTAGGEFVVEGLPKPDTDSRSWYYVVLTCQDSLGRQVRQQEYVGRVWEYFFYDSYAQDSYSLLRKETAATPAPRVAEDAAGGWRYSPYGYSYRSAEWEYFAEGEQVRFALALNDEEQAEPGGRLLTFVSKGRLAGAAVTGGLAEVAYSADLLPNYSLCGAYFDGRDIHLLDSVTLVLDSDERALDIALVRNSASYGPSDDAEVEAVVTDRKTGLPVENAALVLAVVDEAVFAVKDQSIDMWNSVYAHRSYAGPRVYRSRRPGSDGTAVPPPAVDAPEAAVDALAPDAAPTAETREDFRDTAHFATATTGADGRAVFAFHLPDNLTTWRLTGLAAGPGGCVGSATGSLRVTLDYYVTPAVNSTLLEGDSFSVGLRSAGTGLDPKSQVEYTVTVSGKGVEQAAVVTAGPYEYAAVALDALKKGSYTMTIEGRQGSLADRVLLPFTVQDTGLEVSEVQSFNLAKGIDVSPLRYPVAVVAYGEDYQVFGEALRYLRQNTCHGGRADLRLARAFLEDYASVYWYKSGYATVLEGLEGKELLRWFPYGEQDLLLSVKAVLAAPEIVDIGCLAAIDAGYRGPNDTQSISGLSLQPAVMMALAMTGRQVDTALIDSLLTVGGYGSLEEASYYIMALALAGEAEAAQRWYDILITPSLAVRDAGTAKETRWLSRAEAATNADTATALMLATLLGTDDAEGLARYLTQTNNPADLYMLELMYFVAAFYPEGGVTGTFEYTLDGERIEAEVGREVVRLRLSADQLAEADFKVTGGSVTADVYHTAGLDTVETGKDDGVTVTKSIKSVAGGPLKVGDLARITISLDLTGLERGWDGDRYDERAFIVNEYIPSGMRYDSMDSGWETGYLVSRQEQRLQLGVSLREGQRRATVVYYARVTMPGEYVVESAAVRNQAGTVRAVSEREAIAFE